MIKVLEQFASLLDEMKDALVENNVQRIQELTIEQQKCLGELAQGCKENPELKSEVAKHMARLQEKLTLNQQLIEQGLQLTTSVMNGIYKRAGRIPETDTRTANRKSY